MSPQCAEWDGVSWSRWGVARVTLPTWGLLPPRFLLTPHALGRDQPDLPLNGSPGDRAEPLGAQAALAMPALSSPLPRECEETGCRVAALKPRGGRCRTSPGALARDGSPRARDRGVPAPVGPPLFPGSRSADDTHRLLTPGRPREPAHSFSTSRPSFYWKM